MNSVISDEKHPRTVVGYKISKRDQDLRHGIPLSLGKRKPELFLGLSFRLEADEARRYLMVTSSVLLLSRDEKLDQVLLHYDYERNKQDGYPEATYRFMPRPKRGSRLASASTDGPVSLSVCISQWDPAAFAPLSRM